MDQLGLYPLSVILSFLSENDGTCLLLTKKIYAKQVLPIFLWKVNVGLVVVNDRRRRHRFQVSPVQDPIVLLQRLNTQRLKKRMAYLKSAGCQVIKSKQQAEETGFSTTELATAEWKSMSQKSWNTLESSSTFPYPPSLELLRFLDRASKSDDNLEFLKNNGVTLLVSYPRSGNTLLRTLLERITCIVTGSDTRPDRTLSKALAEAHNLVGEGITQQTKTCFVKTHWPERTGCRIFEGHRVILIIRNPFDAIDSYWNLNVTNTHTETVTDEIYESHRDMFEKLVKNEIQVWYDFHLYWLEKSRTEHLPLLLIRFEDLIQNPENEMACIIEFLLHGKSLPSFWKQRIRHATSTTNTTTLGSYKPRTATTGVKSVGKSLAKGRYSKELLDHIHAIAEDKANGHAGENLLSMFGYHITDQGFPENFVKGSAPEISNLVNSNGFPPNSTSVKVNSGELVVG
jgi:hypothetical protein